jgi:hypothetical protein
LEQKTVMRVKTVGLVMGAAALSLLAGGCTAIKDHRGYLVDTALVDSVMVGIDNRQSVEHTLGRPTFVSQYGKEAWYYVSIDTKQTAFHRPRPTAETVLRVASTLRAMSPASIVPAPRRSCGSIPMAASPRPWARSAASSRICSATSAPWAPAWAAVARPAATPAAPDVLQASVVWTIADGPPYASSWITRKLATG